MLVLFLVGKPPQSISVAEDHLADEVKVYKDLIQGDFIDTYDNLTFKTIMGMRWASQHAR